MLFSLLSLLLLSAQTVVSALGQQPLSFSSLSTEEFSHLSHPLFPGYRVRIKRSEWCDPSVASYTGYVDAGPRHLFFYYFESRRSPSQDPLVLWLTGGPGGSSAIGLLMELGPCRAIPLSNSTFSPESHQSIYNLTLPHPHAWNDHANLLFLDQPAGVGFSYVDPGTDVRDSTEAAAKDVWAFLQLFLGGFGLRGKEFHISGESYAGRYIPVYAAYISDQNTRLRKEKAKLAASGFGPAERGMGKGEEEINLQSVLIGNGYTDVRTMIPSYYDMACTNASIPPFLDITQCVRMKRALPRCQRMLDDSCFTILDPLACSAARLFCETELLQPTWTSDRDPYNVAHHCISNGEPVVDCYPIMLWINELLNKEVTRSVLGVDKTVGKWEYGSMDVSMAFASNLDEMHPNQYYVAGLLERGVDVLIYVGTYDNMCNWVGNARWVEAMEWGGATEYLAANWTEWHVDETVGDDDEGASHHLSHVAGGVLDGEHRRSRAGLLRRARGLTFATVDAAGHMVPYDKPAEALAMLNRWLEKRSIV